MNHAVRCSAAALLLVLSVACGRSGPTSPSGTSQPPSLLSQTPGQLPSRPSQTPRTPMDFPPLSGPSRTYIFDDERTYLRRVATSKWWGAPSQMTRGSHLVLYDNGAFLLQYQPSQFGDGRFRGAYQVAYGTMIFLFEFQGRSVGEAADAYGSLKGDLLTIQYVETMQHADIEDAVYVLSSQ